MDTRGSREAIIPFLVPVSGKGVNQTPEAAGTHVPDGDEDRHACSANTLMVDTQGAMHSDWLAVDLR
jgi:hypothetical protein